ncbi:MAG: ABC transporter ATP-binding protein [Casimicrobiaceae bacterium]
MLALDGIDFSIESHSFFTLLGPSGCGKSTILRCVAGLETPDGGDIEIAGRTVFSSSRGIGVPPNRRRIGMVFQSYAIWPHMTVFENVAFPLEVQRQSNVRARTMAALEMVGLGAMADRYASRLSGGQQQRVAFARAIVAEPEVLLLDEPLSNLDAALREQMCGELRKLHERLRLTTLYVTHDQGEALSLSDRIAVMRDGRFVEVATPEELWKNPRTEFAAHFLGGANILAGDAQDGACGAVVQTKFGALHSHHKAQGPVTIFVRPENVALVATGPGANRFECVVVGQRFHGDLREVELQLPHGGPVLRCRTRTPVLSTDRPVMIEILPEHVEVLRPDLGRP